MRVRDTRIVIYGEGHHEKVSCIMCVCSNIWKAGMNVIFVLMVLLALWSSTLVLHYASLEIMARYIHSLLTISFD